MKKILRVNPDGKAEFARQANVYAVVFDVADCGAADKPVYVLNATGKAKMTLRLAAPCAKAEVYDTFGTLVSTTALAAGLQEVAVPKSGYVKICRP